MFIPGRLFSLYFNINFKVNKNDFFQVQAQKEYHETSRKATSTFAETATPTFKNNIQKQTKIYSTIAEEATTRMYKGSFVTSTQETTSPTNGKTTTMFNIFTTPSWPNIVVTKKNFIISTTTATTTTTLPPSKNSKYEL